MSLSNMPVEVSQHIQDTPSQVWTVTHSGIGYPIVDVFMTIDDKVQKVIPKGIAYIDETTIEISFTSERTGFVTVAA